MPVSQYDACTSVASQASRWRWNKLDFYSSGVSIASVSKHPTNQFFEKFIIWNRIITSEKNSFSCETHDT